MTTDSFLNYRTPTQHRILQTYIAQWHPNWGNVTVGEVNVQEAIYAYTGAPDHTTALPLTYQDLETLRTALLAAQQALPLESEEGMQWSLEQVLGTVELERDSLLYGNHVNNPEQMLSEDFPADDNDITFATLAKKLASNLSTLSGEISYGNLASVVIETIGIAAPDLTKEALIADLEEMDGSVYDIINALITNLNDLTNPTAITFRDAIFGDTGNRIKLGIINVNNMIGDINKVEVPLDYIKIKVDLITAINHEGTTFADANALATAISGVFTNLRPGSTNVTVDELTDDISSALTFNGLTIAQLQTRLVVRLSSISNNADIDAEDIRDALFNPEAIISQDLVALSSFIHTAEGHLELAALKNHFLNVANSFADGSPSAANFAAALAEVFDNERYGISPSGVSTQQLGYDIATAAAIRSIGVTGVAQNITDALSALDETTLTRGDIINALYKLDTPGSGNIVPAAYSNIQADLAAAEPILHLVAMRDNLFDALDTEDMCTVSLAQNIVDSIYPATEEGLTGRREVLLDLMEQDISYTLYMDHGSVFGNSHAELASTLYTSFANLLEAVNDADLTPQLIVSALYGEGLLLVDPSHDSTNTTLLNDIGSSSTADTILYYPALRYFGNYNVRGTLAAGLNNQLSLNYSSDTTGAVLATNLLSAILTFADNSTLSNPDLDLSQLTCDVQGAMARAEYTAQGLADALIESLNDNPYTTALDLADSLYNIMQVSTCQGMALNSSLSSANGNFYGPYNNTGYNNGTIQYNIFQAILENTDTNATVLALDIVKAISTLPGGGMLEETVSDDLTEVFKQAMALGSGSDAEKLAAIKGSILNALEADSTTTAVSTALDIFNQQIRPGEDDYADLYTDILNTQEYMTNTSRINFAEIRDNIVAALGELGESYNSSAVASATHNAIRATLITPDLSLSSLTADIAASFGNGDDQPETLAALVTAILADLIDINANAATASLISHAIYDNLPSAHLVFLANDLTVAVEADDLVSLESAIGYNDVGDIYPAGGKKSLTQILGNTFINNTVSAAIAGIQSIVACVGSLAFESTVADVITCFGVVEEL